VIENYQTSKTGSESLTKVQARELMAYLPQPGRSVSKWGGQEKAMLLEASPEPGKWHIAGAKRVARFDN